MDMVIKNILRDDVVIISLLDSVNGNILFPMFCNSFARLYHPRKLVKEDKVSYSVIYLTTEYIVGYVIISRQKIFTNK